jgi:hypothetical protein
MAMRVHTPKLKGPHPLAVLAFCLLWPAAAMVGAITRHDNPPAQAQHAATPTPPAPAMPEAVPMKKGR